MNMLELLSSGVLGALIAIVAREVFGLMHANRAHTLELRKRLFDRKVDVTLTSITQLKLFTTSFRSFIEAKQRSFARQEPLSAVVLEAMEESFREELRRVMDVAPGAQSLLRFFYP